MAEGEKIEGVLRMRTGERIMDFQTAHVEGSIV
jgi:hypothetical protein